PPVEVVELESPQALSTSENARPPSATPVAFIISRLEMAPASRPRPSPASLATSKAATDPSVFGVLTLRTSKRGAGPRQGTCGPHSAGSWDKGRSAVRRRRHRDSLSTRRTDPLCTEDLGARTIATR